jgi:shikimate dehydrogenase
MPINGHRPLYFQGIGTHDHEQFNWEYSDLDIVGRCESKHLDPEAIIVNATSIGLFPHVEGRLDLDLDSLRPGLVVADVIPNPPRTQLIRDAEARGCIVLDGLGMLVNQGAVSIRHWTGIDPETEVMRRKLEKIFGV